MPFLQYIILKNCLKLIFECVEKILAYFENNSTFAIMLKTLPKRLFIITTHTWADLLMHTGLAVAVLGITCILFVYSFLPSITDHGQVITVPDLTGMSFDEAERFLYARGMNYIVGDTSYSRRHKLNVVLSQSPKAGEKVKYGRRIILNVNPKTPPKHKVPNLDGQQIMDAKRILENEGLEVGRVTYKPDFSKDVVLEYYVNGRKMDSATVAKGYLVLVGTKVDLLVADGRGETDFDVPSMIGLSEEEAEEVANAHEISLHKTYDYKSKRPLGTVIWQNPPTHIGTVRKGANAGSYDSRERNKIRSGDVIDIRIAGNPSAEPMTPEELAEYERKKDSLERDIRFRDSKQMDDYYKKWKKEDKDKPKEKKDTKESKDKPKEKKDKKEEKVPEKK